MKEDKIKEIFDDFQPELTSSLQFMNKLQKNMEAVEIVKRHNATVRKRNLIAVVVAAASGLLMGVILTLLYSVSGIGRIAAHRISMPDFLNYTLDVDYSVIAWLVISTICSLTTLYIYSGISSTDAGTDIN